MSDTETVAACKWALCEADASKHVVFGFSKKDLVPGAVIHRDVCSHHVGLIRERFRSVEEYPLGECPSPISVSDIAQAPEQVRAQMLPCV
ncbi:MAG: hypothetical protein ABJA02_08645 [Acidobacteriota bacterium]